MSTKSEKTPQVTQQSDTAQEKSANDTKTPKKPARVPLSKLTGEQIKNRISELDSEINELVERTIKNIAPGRTFDRNLIRQMNKAQREKNRIVATRFTALLDIGHPEAKELLNKLMQIPA